MELCNDYGPGCLAFEYGVNYGGHGGYSVRDCQLQSGTELSQGDCAAVNLDLYIKGPVIEDGEAQTAPASFSKWDGCEWYSTKQI